MPVPERPSAIRRALALYLRSHPLACDTAAGIARWWLPADLDVAESELIPVLDRYQARGLVDTFATADGRCFYRRRRRRPAAGGIAPVGGGGDRGPRDLH